MTCAAPCVTSASRWGIVGTAKFEARIKELVEKPAGSSRFWWNRCSWYGEYCASSSASCIAVLLAIVRDDEVVPAFDDGPWCRTCGGADLTAPPSTCPHAFRNSKAVGAVFGLTPSKYQSGEINRTGAISKCGDEMMRVMLYEAAQIMLVRLAKVVMAQGLGHEDRQTPRNEEGDRGAGRAGWR